jgi:hypothetical protein
MSEPGERQAMLMALRTLEQQGKVVRSGDRRHAYIAGVRVRLTASQERHRNGGVAALLGE